MRLATSRNEAFQQLENFLERAGRDYERDRNFDWGVDSKSNVSQLSPLIRRRVISEGEVCDEVLKRHRYEEAEKFLQEVCWRTYWKGWLQMRPLVWEAFLADLKKLKQEESTHAEYQRACYGKTDLPFFNRWVEELIETGYLHNHARMWFASIWIFTLKLPWQWGAAFFYKHLLDGDPASNTLGWRWVAGLQTKGKQYLATAKNIEKFSSFENIEGEKLASSTFEIEDNIDIPKPAGFDPPNIDAKGDYSLFLHSEDLSPETIDDFKNNPPKKILTVSLSQIDSAIGRSTKVLEIDDQLRREAAERLASFWKVPWDEVERLDTRPLIAAASPVGDWACFLERQEVTQQIWRRWDRDFYPHATHGFFRFKKQISKILKVKERVS